MKILIATGIFPPDIGGPASYGPVLADYLTKNGHEVTVATYSTPWKIESDKNRGFKIIRVWRGWMKPFRHIIFYIKVRRLAKKNDTIISLNAVSVGFPALMAAKKFRKKFYVKIVGDYAWEIASLKGQTQYLLNDFQDTKKTGRIKRLYEMQKKVTKEADGVIVPSQYLFDVVKNWGVDSEKIHVIYNGAEFKPLELTKEEARKKLGIPGNIIFSYGRLVPWKGFMMLIKIMPKLLEANQFFRLIIAGDGPEKSKLEQMAKNMGLEKKVFLVGRKSKEEIALYLAASDTFVLNSGYEGFSHQILEAMTAGVPVIASAIGGNKEIIKQGQNGFLVKYNDEFNLIEAIKGMHKLAEMREQFIAEAKETASHFTVEKMLEETKRLIT